MNHLVKHHSEGKDIRGKTVLALLQGLQTHVEGRTQIELMVAQFDLLDCKTKVTQLALPSLQQYILRLYVSVHYLSLLEFSHGRCDLLSKKCHQRFRQSVS